MPNQPLRFGIFGILLLACISAFGQTPTPKPTPDDEVIKVDSRLIVIPVSVTDANGQAITGLTAADFRIAEEGRQQTIESLGSADVVPLEIALLFDISASTDPMFRFEQETAAKFLREVMRADDRATIFTIGQTPSLVQSRETTEKAVDAIFRLETTKGATAFFDTVKFAADHLRRNSPEGRRRVVVIISDGEDNFSVGVQKAQRAAESRLVEKGPDPEFKKLGKVIVQAQEMAKTEERQRVLRSLQDADIVHYSINPAGSSYLLNKISVFGQENMQRFSTETGGTAFLPKFLPVDTKDQYQNSNNRRQNSETLERIFRQLANELRSQYLIQYYSESEFPANKFVKLDVAVPTRGGARVRSRQGYYVKN
ncbi:MAG: VWA domain-containing protein [Acidobacteria bacterium]|nr:VWA domain-containing protein [Acidobacteriota bacterium]